MPNVDEVMQDNETLSFDLTMRSVTRRTAFAPVTLSSGCVVDCVTRQDGSTVWVDQSCQRATPPSFGAHARPFVDEAVAAWHDGTVDLTDRNAIERELVTSGALVIALRSDITSVDAQIDELLAEKATLKEAEAKSLTRRENAILAAVSAKFQQVDIATHARMSRQAVRDWIVKGGTNEQAG